MTYPNNLGRLRGAQKLSQRELAAMLPSNRQQRDTIHERTIDRWERGTIPIPQRYWQPLADIFGCSITHLLKLEHENGEAA